MNKLLLILVLVALLISGCLFEALKDQGACRYGVLGSKCKECSEDECSDLGGIWFEDESCSE